MNKLLKSLRVIISVAFFAAISFYFLDFANITGPHFWIGKIQLLPALLAGSFTLVGIWILLTLLFGRIYCSTICPIGTMQDVISRISVRFNKDKKGRKKHFSYSQPKNALRYILLALITGPSLFGFQLFLLLLDPYSAFGRIMVNIFKPIYTFGNNVLAGILTSIGNYTLYQVDIVLQSLLALCIAVVTLGVIAFMSWKNGRTWCNTICPVGAFLSLLSRFSLLRIRVDRDKCNRCGSCAHSCKASCISSVAKKIDVSRCVDCFNCLEKCPQGALYYGFHLKKKKGHSLGSLKRIPKSTKKVVAQVEPADQGKRQFLVTALTTAVAIPTLLAQDKKKAWDALSQPIGNKKDDHRKVPLTPPGSESQANLLAHCTACHLCISKCPSHVLKPALMEYGLAGIMQPTVSFEKGFCNFDCTLCGELCPTGAIRPLTVERKHLTQIGKVVFVEENCIVYKKGTNCGACSEHCPTQAIAMVPYKDGLTIPKVDANICVGCGGCEYVCPSKPFRAVHIEGNVIHRAAKHFVEGHEKSVKVDEFGF